MDPYRSDTQVANQVINQIFNQLIYRLPGVDGAYQPGLATSYEVNDNSTAYTFHLRKDVRFQDGTPFNAEAVKAAFDRIVDPATKSNTTKSELGPYTGTKVIDDYTAEIDFKSPNPDFAYRVVNPEFGIPSPTATKKYGAAFGDHPVGTGPFTFVSWNKGQQIVLKRTDGYNVGPTELGTGPAPFESLTFRVLTDQAAQYNALRTGEIDVADNLTAQDLAAASSSGMNVIKSTVSGMPYGFFINSTLQPLTDPAVRRAIENGIDRKQIVDTLFDGQYSVATSVFTKATRGYVDGSQYMAYDPAAAKSALAAAGWTAGSDGVLQKDGKPLELKLANVTDWSGPGTQQMGTLIQAQLKQIGIKVDLVNETTSTASARITDANGSPYAFAPMYYYDNSPSLLQATFGCAALSSWNWGRTCDKTLESMMQGSAAASGEEGTKLGSKAADYINQQNLFIPIMNLQLNLVSAKIKKIPTDVTADPFYFAAKD